MISGNTIAFVRELVRQEPTLNELFQAHVEDYGEVLPYLFMADVRSVFLAAVGGDRAFAVRLATVVDRGWEHEDSDVRDLVGITFGEDLLGDDTDLVRACLTERMRRHLDRYH